MEFEIKKNPCKKNSGNRRKKKEKKKKWVVFVFFLRHFIIFQTRIDDFEMCGGSPGQNFFRILAKKHFEKIFLGDFWRFFRKKIEDFLATKNEISAQKNFFIAYKNFF